LEANSLAEGTVAVVFQCLVDLWYELRSLEVTAQVDSTFSVLFGEIFFSSLGASWKGTPFRSLPLPIMVVQTRGNPNGPRFLTQRNLEKRIQAATGDGEPFRPKVDKGFMQLFSYYKPGLTAGNYCIIAEQFISATKQGQHEQKLRICNRKGTAPIPDTQPGEKQIFEVMAPQFSLDPKLVNSFYPPEGHQDEGRILPHLVINDPHFPWERDADSAFAGGMDDDLGMARLRDPDRNANGDTVDKDGKVTDVRENMMYRSIIPWVRLLVVSKKSRRVGARKRQHRSFTQPKICSTNFADTWSRTSTSPTFVM
jgi:hypothetical protein